MCQLPGSWRAFLAGDLAARMPFPTAGNGQRCPLKGRGPLCGSRGAGAPSTRWAGSGRQKGLPVPLGSRESSLPPGQGHSSAPPAGEAWTGLLQQAPPRPPGAEGAAPSPSWASGPTSGSLGADRPFPVSVSKVGDVLLRTLGTCSLLPPQPTGGEAPHKPSETALKRRPGPHKARDHPAGPQGPLTRCTRRGLGGRPCDHPGLCHPSRQPEGAALGPSPRPGERPQGTGPLPSGASVLTGDKLC